MSIYPDELAAHAAGQVTTLCQCWRVTRKDGAVLGFTDHDRALNVDGTECRPGTGFAASEARSSLGLAVDTTDIEGALSDDEITAEAIGAGAFDGAVVETFLVNWRDPAQFAALRKAVVGRIVRRDGQFVAELESLTSYLDRPEGRYLTRGCVAELGDARCGFALGQPGYSASGTVAGVEGADRVSASGLDGFEGGWFTNGVLTWTSGVDVGRKDRVLAHSKNGGAVSLTLWRETPTPPVSGATFDIVAGCDKSFATCRAKFSNTASFRGFPHLPGNDVAHGYVRDGAIFDGGPLVP